MIATAEIDLTRPTGRRIVRNLERHKKTVRINYPLPNGVSGTGYTLEESYNKGLDLLSSLYGTDFRKL